MKPVSGAFRNRCFWPSAGRFFPYVPVAVLSFFFGYVCRKEYEIDFVLLKDYLGIILNYPFLAFIAICVIFRHQVREFIDRSRYGSESFKQSGHLSGSHRKSIFERNDEGASREKLGTSERVSNASSEADIERRRDSRRAIGDIGISGDEAGQLDLFLKPHTKRVLKWIEDTGPVPGGRVKDELSRVGLEPTEAVAVMDALYENGLIEFENSDLGWKVTGKGRAFLKLIKVQLISFP